MKKYLEIPFLETLNSSIEELAVQMDLLPKQAIDFVPWSSFQYAPKVNFAMAHTENSMILKFNVEEKGVKAYYRNSNEPVYKDSCVEFFIAFADEAPYYNFEFNCMGTCLVQYGVDKEGRQYLSPLQIKKIRTHTHISNVDADGLINWKLTVEIPHSLFGAHNFKETILNDAKVNFYKCGDDLEIPHYLTWSPVASASPDFHLPAYFGDAKFLKNKIWI